MVTLVASLISREFVVLSNASVIPSLSSSLSKKSVIPSLSLSAPLPDAKSDEVTTTASASIVLWNNVGVTKAWVCISACSRTWLASTSTLSALRTSLTKEFAPWTSFVNTLLSENSSRLSAGSVAPVNWLNKSSARSSLPVNATRSSKADAFWSRPAFCEAFINSSSTSLEFPIAASLPKLSTFGFGNDSGEGSELASIISSKIVGAAPSNIIRASRFNNTLGRWKPLANFL